jgi:hypothetical protein
MLSVDPDSRHLLRHLVRQFDGVIIAQKDCWRESQISVRRDEYFRGFGLAFWKQVKDHVVCQLTGKVAISSEDVVAAHIWKVLVVDVDCATLASSLKM